jgi:hypothetical protein
VVGIVAFRGWSIRYAAVESARSCPPVPDLASDDDGGPVTPVEDVDSAVWLPMEE